jgi:hypothetical protein
MDLSTLIGVSFASLFIGYLLLSLVALLPIGKWFKQAGMRFETRKRRERLARELAKLERGDIRGIARQVASFGEASDVGWLVKEITRRGIAPVDEQKIREMMNSKSSSPSGPMARKQDADPNA